MFPIPFPKKISKIWCCAIFVFFHFFFWYFLFGECQWLFLVKLVFGKILVPLLLIYFLCCCSFPIVVFFRPKTANRGHQPKEQPPNSPKILIFFRCLNSFSTSKCPCCFGQCGRSQCQGFGHSSNLPECFPTCGRHPTDKFNSFLNTNFNHRRPFHFDPNPWRRQFGPIDHWREGKTFIILFAQSINGRRGHRSHSTANSVNLLFDQSRQWELACAQFANDAQSSTTTKSKEENFIRISNGTTAPSASNPRPSTPHWRILCRSKYQSNGRIPTKSFAAFSKGQPTKSIANWGSSLLIQSMTESIHPIHPSLSLIPFISCTSNSLNFVCHSFFSILLTTHLTTFKPNSEFIFGH